MSRIEMADPTATTPDRKEIFDEIHGAFGVVPNMFRTIGASHAALSSMWGSFKALGGGVLGAAVGEQIAVRVAQLNGCDYCLSAHTVLGKKAGVSAEDMAAAQNGASSDVKIAAILTLVEALVTNRAHVDEASITAARENGLSDEEIAEVIAHVALNVFTNYTNVALDVEVDFPRTALVS